MIFFGGEAWALSSIPSLSVLWLLAYLENVGYFRRSGTRFRIPRLVCN